MILFTHDSSQWKNLSRQIFLQLVLKNPTSRLFFPIFIGVRGCTPLIARYLPCAHMQWVIHNLLTARLRMCNPFYIWRGVCAQTKILNNILRYTWNITRWALINALHESALRESDCWHITRKKSIFTTHSHILHPICILHIYFCCTYTMHTYILHI